jgi:hypothetical protein
VHYYKNTQSACTSKTFIGTRVAPYCVEYTQGSVPVTGPSPTPPTTTTTTTDCATQKTTWQCRNAPPPERSHRRITQQNIPNCLPCTPTPPTITSSSILDPLTGVTTTTTITTNVTCTAPTITVSPAVTLPSFTNLSDIIPIPLPTAVSAPTVPYPITCAKAVPAGGFSPPNFSCTSSSSGCITREIYNTIKRTTTTTTTITTSQIPALNSCLTGCESHRTNIRNYGTPTLPSLFLFGAENSDEREKYHMQPQIWLKDFVSCRRECFDTNGFQNGINGTTKIPIMTANEGNLNKWIMLPLSDNVTDAQVLTGTNERDALQSAFSKTKWRDTAEHIKKLKPARNTDSGRLEHFTAKTYGPLVHTVVNQWDGSTSHNPYLNGFVNNTYHADKIFASGPVIPTSTPAIATSRPTYTLTAGTIDNKITASLSTFPPDGDKSQDDYFYRQIRATPTNQFKQISLDANENLTNLVLNTNVSGPGGTRFGCNKWAYIGMCITTFANDGSCDTCIAPDTQVTMYNGTTKAIKDLKIGDRVKALHGKDAEIKDITELDWKELALYNINNGLLRLTADHPVMTKDGWRAINYNIRNDNKGYGRYGIKKVKTLKIGDILITDNSAIAVTHIMPESPIKNGKTFNLKLKNSKGFYANGVWVRTQN